MPAVLPFLPLILAGVGAAGVGTSVYEGVKNRDASAEATAEQQAALKQQQQSAANQANLTKQEAVIGAQGETQAQTGGSLTDPGTASLTDLLAGYPGYQGGTTTGTDTGTSPTGTAPNITAILSALQNGGTSSGLGSGLGSGAGSSSSISGGNWQTSLAQPQPRAELANPIV